MILRIELLQASRNVGSSLLHGVKLAVLGHGSRVIAVLVHQSLKPLHLSLAHMSNLLGCWVLCLFDKRAHNLGISLVVDDAAPLGIVLVNLIVFVIGVEVVERVVEGVVGVRNYADNLAVGITFNRRLAQCRLLDGINGERVGLGLGIDSFALELLLDTAGGCLKARKKTKTAVVLCKSFFLVPSRTLACWAFTSSSENHLRRLTSS